MAAVIKLFLVLVAFICCMQLVEMARLRRDAPEKNPIDELTTLFQKATKDFTQTVEESTVLKEIKEKFSNINSDDVKKAVEEAGKNTKENLDKFQDFFKNVVDAVAKEMKHD
ncbi:uncharacterized protein LOC111688156 [Lucilia cuprina]|uniref:uncharacterized protein LOC111688156 n=1 Tax=Lucilia cuprina TaxID=7375 RepID=UPI001F063B2C|nr:uncharacterized protein LOC111688156 [Lucilia cuprina]